MKPNIKKLLIALAIPLAVGGLAALLSGGIDNYRDMVKPPFSPPAWLFPVVWSILYLLMGYASYRVYTTNAPTKESALRLYAAQLLLNFLWPLVFFGLEMPLLAFFILIALWVLILLTMRAFSKIDETAGNLLLPYLLWVTFAGYLNFGVYLLN